MIRAPIIGPVLLFVGLMTAVGIPRANAEDAKALFEQARAAFHDGKYAEAADMFRAAYEMRPSWKILFNIGQSEAAAARYGLALEAFELYLVQGADDVPQERRDEVLKEVERIRILVGFLAVEAEDGMEVRVDGVARGKTPLTRPIRVAAGEHSVEVLKGEETVITQVVSIAGGVTSTVSTVSEGPVEAKTQPESPPPEAQPAPAAPAPAVSKEKPSKWKLAAGISFLGVGAAGIAVGAVFAVKGSKDYQKAKDYQGVDREKFDEYNDEKVPRDRVLTIVGFAVGGAFAVAGATLTVLHLRKQKKSRSTGAVQVGPGGLSVCF